MAGRVKKCENKDIFQMAGVNALHEQGPSLISDITLSLSTSQCQSGGPKFYWA